MAPRKGSSKKKTAAAAKTTGNQPPREFRLRDNVLNMLPSSYNAAALIPAAHFYVPDYALASVVLTRAQLSAYYPRANAILEQEIAMGNGAAWTRSAAFGGASKGVVDKKDGGANSAVVAQGYCAFAGLALELKENIFCSMLSDHGGAFMRFEAYQYTSSLQELFALAATSKAFRAEVFAFIAERTHLVATVHFYTLFRCYSVPYMPHSHATLIKQFNVGIEALTQLNWLPYLSKTCMPNLQKVVVVWERIESYEGKDDQQTKELAQYAALGRVALHLKRLCHRACSYGSSSCWMWEIIEGNTRSFVVQFSVQVSIMRVPPPDSVGGGGGGLSLNIPGLGEYLHTQHCLIELTRNAKGSVLGNTLFWKLQTISEEEKNALVVAKEFD
ncbi:hypothetical protein DV736_g850, partial [Chaetothyriales sp. CBS 134916]